MAVPDLLRALAFPGMAAVVAWAQSGEAALKQVDRYRYPWPAFSVDVDLRDGRTRQQWRVTIRADGDARVEGLSEKEKGRTVLLLKDQMWLLLPNAKRPVKISPQQRLMGPAAGGDIARFRFWGDYALAGERDDPADGRPAKRLDLQAVRKAMSYRKAVLWITPEGIPILSEFYFASGKLARTAWFGAVVQERGVPVLSGLVLDDPQGNRTELTFSRWNPIQPDDRLFELPEADR